MICNDLENRSFSVSLNAWVRSRTAEIGVQELLKDWRNIPRDLKDNASVIRFARVKAGQSATKSYFIISEGSSPLKNLSIMRDGKDAGDFIISTVKKTTLKTGAVTTFKVTFKPTSKGPKRAAIHIKSNDPDENPFDIRLTGSGSAP